jgi:hypothetical protein
LSAIFIVEAVCETATEMQILFTIYFTTHWRSITCAKGDGRHLSFFTPNKPVSPDRCSDFDFVDYSINTLTYISCNIAPMCHDGDMPRMSPFCIVLSASEKNELGNRSTKYTLPYCDVIRAKMILYAAEGWSNDEIARRLDTRREVVSLWRKRFFTQRLAGLQELSRAGRPRSSLRRSHGAN